MNENINQNNGSEAAVNNTAIPRPAGAINPYYTPGTSRVGWTFGPGDAAFAVCAFALGMLFWDWIFVMTSSGPGISVTLFFAVAAAVTGIYLHRLGCSQSRRSAPALAVLLAGAAPFTLYDGTEIYIFLLLFEFAAALVWIMYTCGGSVSTRLSGYILADLANQVFVVPFANFAGPFKAAARGARERKSGRAGLHAFIGILVAIPLIAGVIALLMAADAGFANVMKAFAELINLETIGTYLLKLLIGIPVACYIFGSAFGNGRGRCANHVTKPGADAALSRAHRLPLSAVRPVLIILAALYALFFIAMGTYLFSGFAGGLPHEYTYAEYARRGFFELCGVAAINLAVIIFVYLFAKRGPGEYPKSLRVLTAVISSMTVLLIITAASKMFLYVDSYGLTRLRVYTLWFMLLMLCVFIVIAIWHIRPMNAGKPVVIIFVLLTLALFYADTDGLIAKYNVEQYRAGALESVDTEVLTYMSDAVVPYLAELKENAADADVRAGAAEALRIRREIQADDTYEMYAYTTGDWRSFNIQSALTGRHYSEDL